MRQENSSATAVFLCIISIINLTFKKCIMKKFSWEFKKFGREKVRLVSVLLLLFVCCFTVYGQDGIAGINEANQKVRSYFDAGTELMYAVGAILGLIGAVKVYQKWNAGDQDTGKVAAAWFGSCVFLVVVATVIKSFFGV
jgi:hypothetical protein